MIYKGDTALCESKAHDRNRKPINFQLNPSN